MTQGAPDRFDIDCLRHVVADPEVQRVSLAAAMIKVHALSIARSAPLQRDEALAIVGYLDTLYAGLPDRRSIRRLLEEHPRSTLPSDRAKDDLAEALWSLFRRGRNKEEPAMSGPSHPLR